MNSKYGQFSIEFLLIFLFIMSFVSILIVFLGGISLEFGIDEKKKEVDDFGRSIIKEFEIAQSVEGGYNRTFIIEQGFMERFNVTIEDDILFVTDTYASENKNQFLRHYSIPGNFNTTTHYNPINKTLTISIYKRYTDDFNGITLQK